MGSCQLRGFFPPVTRLIGDLHDFTQPLIVELPAGNLLQLVNDVIQLSLHIFGVVILHLVGVVKRRVKHNQRNIELFGQVFIPLDHRVADIAGAQEEIRHGHILRLTVLQLRIRQVDPGIGT